MILGQGIDIIEVNRIQKAIEKSKSFKEKIFTANEINYCESKNNKFQAYSVRFAAKEAFFKAIGTGWAKGMKWTDVEVYNNDEGKPFLKLHGIALEISEKNNVCNIHLSLSHIKDTAIASVILEKV